MPAPKKPRRPLPEKTFEVVRRGFAPGITKVRVPIARVAKTRVVTKNNIMKFSNGLRKMDFNTVPPRKLLSVALYCLSIPELSKVKFGPKKQAALLEGHLVKGLKTGMKQSLTDIVGRYHKRKAERKTPLLTEGEVNFLRKNLPNVRNRIERLVESKEFGKY